VSEYKPDAWVIVRFTNNGVVTDKVLAGWYGGYGGSDSWKASSGIVYIEETDNEYLVYNHSGSIYTCHKETERMTGLMGSMYESWATQIAALPEPRPTMELIEISTILEKYYELRD